MAEGDAASTEASGAASPSSVPPSARDAWSGSADRYRALIEAADDAILVADFDSGSILEANPAACELFGYALPEFSSRPLRGMHEDDEEVLRVFDELERRERAWHPNLRTLRKDGSVFWAELRAKAFLSGGHKLVLFILRDVTHRVDREIELARAYHSLKDTQAKLVHSGKLAAIGQIAGGVAHEVNNPATFILTNLRLMRDSVAQVRGALSKLRRALAFGAGLDPARQAVVDAVLLEGDLDSVLRETGEMVEDNLAGIERIASIVKDLRVFSRIEHEDVQHVAVNDVVDVACNLAYADIRHRARLIKQLRRLPKVSGEPGKLAQVFTSILVCSAHSIEEGAAGENEIRVSTWEDGPFAVVTVQDTGADLSEALRGRLFESGFGGKESEGAGAGIGLSLATEIVQLHGGTLEIESGTGQGNRFEVRLPAAADVTESPETTAEPEAEIPAGLRARILVIDDDPAVLRAYRRMLAPRHDVVLASGGAAGLETLAGDADFDVVLCDVMMPEVDGPMVFEALSQRLPDVLGRVVFCSGGAFTPRAKEFLASVSNTFLAKPIDTDELYAIIEQARAERARAP